MVKPVKKWSLDYYKRVEKIYDSMSDEQLKKQIIRHDKGGKISKGKSETALYFLMKRMGF